MPADEELAHAEYWDSKYSTDAGATFDWFRSFSSIKPYLTRELPPPPPSGSSSSSTLDPKPPSSSSSPGSTSPKTIYPKIIHLGSGTSTLPVDLEELGYEDQLAVDFSEVVVEMMRGKCREEERKVRWELADVRDMKALVEDGTMDIAIDKGTLDAMLFGSLWDLDPEVELNTSLYLGEIRRILKPGGKFLYITYRQPHFIRPILQREGYCWEKIAVESLVPEEGGLEYFSWTGVRR